MNKSILMGRLTRDPEIRYTQGENALCIARFTLAVDRRFKRDGEQEADFIPCVAFGKQGEFMEKYFRKGMKAVVSGRIQTGSYTNRDGVKVYTTEIAVEDVEFAESKGSSGGNNSGQGQNQNQNQNQNRNGNSGSNGQQRNNNSNGNSGGSYGNQGQNQSAYSTGGFMNIPDGIDEELPFN